MRKRLTDRTLNGLKATGRRYDVWDETLGGFGVRVQATVHIIRAIWWRAQSNSSRHR
jgi:hypothetical protein